MALDLAMGHEDWSSFGVGALVTAFAGGMLVFAFRGGTRGLELRQAFLLTALAWVGTAAAAALPFIFSDRVTTYTDAFFEAISGLTTTGSTVLVGLDDFPPGILLWRGLLNWLGGVGIVAMVILVLPYLRVGGMQLFQTESSDRSDRVLPRPGQTVAAIVGVYVALTAACALAYRLAGMTTFDAVNHAFATLATGGFSTHDLSFGNYRSHAIQWIGIVFMIAGALPFLLFVRAVRGEALAPLRDSQVRAFLYLLASAIAAICAWRLVFHEAPAPQVLTEVAFNVVSVVTTTGFVNADYNTWGAFAVVSFFVLTFVGGCTGSTSGAIKIFRLQIMAITALRQLKMLVAPRAVLPLRYNGRSFEGDVPSSVLVFVFLYVTSVAILAVALSVLGLDPLTSLSGAATAVGNVGPGLGDIIGPAGNFSTLPDAAKWLLSAGMLLGRLELMTVFVLLTPYFWRQ
jgi:trk system potassium uptake protein TrkH